MFLVHRNLNAPRFALPGNSASRKAASHQRLTGVDSGSCVEGQKNHESREAKTGALLDVLMGTRHTAESSTPLTNDVSTRE